MNKFNHQLLINRPHRLCLVLFAALQLSGWAAHAQTQSNVADVTDAQSLSQIQIPKSFTDPPVIMNQGLQGAYVPEATPANLARIVLYRTPGDSLKTEDGLFIYLNGKLQTVLRPGGFSSFCVDPSQHTLDTTWGVSEYAPTKGKVTQNYQGGKTYYYQASAAKGDGSLKTVAEKSAQMDLAKTQKQTHLVSRSTSALPCKD
jgi:hypothetical protein